MMIIEPTIDWDSVDWEAAIPITFIDDAIRPCTCGLPCPFMPFFMDAEFTIATEAACIQAMDQGLSMSLFCHQGIARICPAHCKLD